MITKRLFMTIILLMFALLSESTSFAYGQTHYPPLIYKLIATSRTDYEILIANLETFIPRVAACRSVSMENRGEPYLPAWDPQLTQYQIVEETSLISYLSVALRSSIRCILDSHVRKQDVALIPEDAQALDEANSAFDLARQTIAGFADEVRAGAVIIGDAQHLKDALLLIKLGQTKLEEILSRGPVPKNIKQSNAK